MRRRFYTTPIKVTSAHFITTPWHGLRNGPGSPAHRKGHAHERRVAEHLEGNEWVVYGPWIEYCTQGGRISTCQPDFLVFNPSRGVITILEAKLRHCPEAYFQLRNLYAPLLKFLFPAWEIRLQEVVRWYDRLEHFPGEHVLREKLLDAPPPHQIGVHIFGDAP